MNGWQDLLEVLGSEATAVGVAVVTAVLTTLVVEYAAKPRLEARKARMIRDRQQVDEVIFAFQKASLLASAALPADHADDEDLIRHIHQKQVMELGAALDELLNAIGRLPTRFVAKHGEHIGWTAKFLGYARSLTILAGEGHYIDDARIRQIAIDMSVFDTYFVANVDFRDNQEPLIKRWFWKRFTAGGYRADAAATMDDRYGGSARPPKDEDEAERFRCDQESALR